jgi:hypothetical protein
MYLDGYVTVKVHKQGAAQVTNVSQGSHPGPVTPEQPASRERVATALVNQGFRLGELGRPAEANRVYDELLDRLGDAPESACAMPSPWPGSPFPVPAAGTDRPGGQD